MSQAQTEKNTHDAPGGRAGVRETTEDCRYCWMCRHVCPVGHVTHRETFTPHAWALTIASVKRGALAWNAETTDVLYACADCGLCRAHCVTDRALPDAIALARADVVSVGQAPAAVRELDGKLRAWGNPYGDRAALPAALQELAKGEGTSDDATRGAGARSSAGTIGAGATGAGGGGAAGGVALFVGDAAAFLTPATLDAARALLAAAGVNAVPIGVGRSTGLLADTLGLADTASTLARDLIAEVTASGCKELLVFSAADRYAFERVYKERLQLDWPEGVKVTEVTTVLADAQRAGRIAFTPPPPAAVRAAEPPSNTSSSQAPVSGASNAPAGNGLHEPTYAYHGASHGPRLGRDAAAAHALLSAALGESAARHPFWRDQRAHPTGAAGGLEFTHPAIAAALNDARIADAARAGARWLIADEPADLHQLRQHATGIEVVCLYELLSERLVR